MRDALKDPKPGDLFIMEDGEEISIQSEGIMTRRPPGQQYGIRAGSLFFTYRTSAVRGLICYQSKAGMVKRLRNAVVLRPSKEDADV